MLIRAPSALRWAPNAVRKTAFGAHLEWETREAGTGSLVQQVHWHDKAEAFLAKAVNRRSPPATIRA